MGQPTPPGDMPLFEGLGAEWNDIVNAIPEDKRAEVAPLLKQRIDAYEPLKAWEKFSKDGITPELADTAFKVYKTIEDNPRDVYEVLGKHLGITPAQAEKLTEELEEDDSGNPEIEALKQQVETLSAITLAERRKTQQEQMAAEADAKLNEEVETVRKKYGNDIPEDQILMRMLHKDMTAEQAAQEYIQWADQVRSRRPSPLIMGGAGSVPGKKLDPTKLNNKETKTVVAQMLEHAKAERDN
jgi:hypothetical protein